MRGLCEEIATALAVLIREDVPCHIEGSDNSDDWANVHICGVGSKSVTITVCNGQIIVGVFYWSLQYRADIASPRHAYNYGSLFSFSLSDPECIELAVETAISYVLSSTVSLSRDHLLLILRSKSQPSSVKLGKPFYTV